MVWAKRAAALGVAAILGVAGPALAETLVVRASGPSARNYPPGAKLADGGSLLLKAGDVVTLLDAKGTRTLRGPGRFGVTAAASAALASNVTLAALLDTKRVRRARTGAVRGALGEAPAVAKRPNLWLVDIAQPGALCVADPPAVRLWRVDATKPLSLRISGGGVQAAASFAAGETIAAWPATLPVKDGASYRLEAGGRSSDIRFALLNAADIGLDGTAAALIAHGCQAQLDLLVETAAR
ncbi:hypothetical protein [Sphingobium sp. EP60837]|uniref:hypothetical protein n=1 Tax=Sphingobium sp. EP60837 TaxID=1855519 RepID=UPI0007DCFFCC|nr:hypothetical protein [Sphingobium sp. EP60837]ANI79562.1 hypothetical protein EP837_03174 [Sphingobium sp. EP60837]